MARAIADRSPIRDHRIVVPELPEVETLVRQLRPLIVGRRIIGATLTHDNLLDGVTKRVLLRALPGLEITAVERRAKHALVWMGDRVLAVQPGMSGSLLRFRRPLTAEQQQYAVLRCHLDDGSWLVYRDVRRIGTIRWLEAPGWDAYAARLGPEPLDAAFTAADFADRLGRSTAAIKKVLMNQRVVVGVGNIYANEALFAAGIRPSRRANQVARKRLQALHGEVRRILLAAIVGEGSTIRDYVSSAGEAGRFQRSLAVYGRGGEPCRTCGMPLSSTHAIDNRATVYCRGCQK